MRRNLFLSLVLIAIGVCLGNLPRTISDEKKSEFASTTIDLGTVVSDVEKAVKFYTEAIGFKEVQGFEVPGDFAKDSGLTSGSGFKVRVLVLGDGPTATKLKLIEMPSEKPKKNENDVIHAEYGFRYLTIAINDTDAAIERLKKAGVKPIAKGPVPLPKGFPSGVALTIVRDPDGNFVELVGPKK
jgi:catechol 2,3-dioxygenase-like lactoylglutathione lyase family enzyme